MAQPIVTIIGLGQTGTSLGLALRRDESDFDLVGHDKEPTNNNLAKKAGAVDRTDWNLHNAVDGAALVVLAIPIAEVDETLQHIGEDLVPGNLVLACVTSMQPAIAAAEKHLPDGVHFVAAHPIVTDTESTTPRADLFDEAVFALAPGLQTDPDAIGLASDLIERIGANPLYMDPQEHDGIVAGVDALPMLLAAAMMRVSSTSPGWSESQRLAGRRFARLTDLGVNAAQIEADLLANREALVGRLDQLQAELSKWRLLLQSADSGQTTGDEQEDPLLSAIDAAVDARLHWESAVKLKRWNDAELPAADVQNTGVLRQLFFGNLFNGRKPREGGSDDKPSS